MAPVRPCQALSSDQPRPLDGTRMEVKGQLISSPTFSASGGWLVPRSASSPALSQPAYLERVGPWPHAAPGFPG